jgi:hypothetical protein
MNYLGSSTTFTSSSSYNDCIIFNGDVTAQFNVNDEIYGYNNLDDVVRFTCVTGSTYSGGYTTLCTTQSLGSASNIIVRNLTTSTQCGCASFIGNGEFNTLSGYFSFIGGGTKNVTGTGNANFIGAGSCNFVNGDYGAVVSGRYNTTSGCHSFTGSGYCNTTSGYYAFTGSGCFNTASANYSAILGGKCNNTSTFCDSFILGSCLTSLQACTTFVNCISPANLTIGKAVCTGANNVLVDYSPITKLCSIASGTSIIDTSERFGYNAVFYNFTITDCTNYYAGVLTAVWDALTGTITFTETSTSSIGNTSGVSFSFTITGNDVNLVVSVPSALWKFSFTKTVLEDCCTMPYFSGAYIITEDGNSPPNERIVTEDLPSQEIINNLGDFLVDNLGNLIATNSITSENLITE